MYPSVSTVSVYEHVSNCVEAEVLEIEQPKTGQDKTQNKRNE